MTRVVGSIYPSREAALKDGWADAEYGWWVPANGDISQAQSGWIALDKDEEPHDIAAIQTARQLARDPERQWDALVAWCASHPAIGLAWLPDWIHRPSLVADIARYRSALV